MKLRKLHIEDYKMFKDFDISFVDDNDEALPIIVLAGVNGSGKTTILKSMSYLLSDEKIIKTKVDIESDEIWYKKTTIHNAKDNMGNVEYRNNDEELNKAISRTKFSNEIYMKRLVYFPSGIDDTKKVADEFVKTFYFYLKEKDFRPSEVKEHFHNYMKDIFNGLELTFKYSHLDRDDNVWFTNDNGEQFEIKDLSTGEKTLLSKVMYLYFLGYKNKVILIDEPELSLHPSWQNRVLKIYENFATENECQIIIATHSPHIIASAKNEYLRFLIKEDNKIIVKQLYDSPLDRDINTIVQTIMGANYIPQELEQLRREYREFFDKELETTDEAKELERRILMWESPNSSFWQSIAFDKELRSI